MTTLRDLLLELRAVRIGYELWLRTTLGVNISLLELAEKDEVRNYELHGGAPKKPRDAKSLIHRDDAASAARERLSEMGDDTHKMIAKIREEFGDEAAEGMRQFYEKEIVGKK